MTPKKNNKADLEGKRTVFFLLGLALSLTAAIYVIQLEHGIEQPLDGCPAEYTFTDDDPVMITVRKVEQPPQHIKKVDNTLPPEVTPDPVLTLDVSKIFSGPEGPEEDPVEIGRNDDLHLIETLDFVVMENIARPYECEGVGDKSEQKECFNQWIKEYIAKNTSYPELARQVGLQGKVYVNFVISESGEVEEVTLVHGEYEILNSEAVRVLSAMPKMIPGSQRGRKAKMTMTVPVNFKLPSR